MYSFTCEFLAWLEEELRDPKEGRTITEVNIHMCMYEWIYKHVNLCMCMYIFIHIFTYIL
jgi:hypothetical protein